MNDDNSAVPVSPLVDLPGPASPAVGPPGSAASSSGPPQPLVPLPVCVNDVLGSLFAPNEPVCLRVFDDKKGGVFRGQKLQCECGKYRDIEDTLKQHNAMNCGVFFVVNYGGHDDASITRINAQFFEMDNSKLWLAVVDTVAVRVDGRLVFRFRNGVKSVSKL